MRPLQDIAVSETSQKGQENAYRPSNWLAVFFFSMYTTEMKSIPGNFPFECA